MKKHTDLVKKKAQGLFETQRKSPAEIYHMTGIPLRTVNFWKKKEQWKHKEETAEEVILAEFKRLIMNKDLNETNLRKAKFLRTLLDDYQNRQSLFLKEIEEEIKKMKQTTQNPAELNSLIRIVNKHTGSGLKLKRENMKKPVNDFTGVQFKA